MDNDFKMKTAPQQDRAKETINLILTTTGELLEDVGFERLSTNMICKQCNLTPPALYRYFPNKYAILKELADQLVSKQEKATIQWVESGGIDAIPLEEVIENNLKIQAELTDIIRNFPGGVWITRAIRAIPMLHQVRTQSREAVSESVYNRLLQRFPTADKSKLKIATIMSTELMNNAAEMVIEEPELGEDKVFYEVCQMVALYYEHQFSQL